MPFIDIRLAGSVTREQRSAIVADVTRSMVERLGKSPAAVQVCIVEVPTDSYGSGGILIADRPAAAPAQGDAPADGKG
ncbi:tautomerase family protein [Sphingomonas quercus]|uniref:4-oxalocrotonate tautomerase family protein n=1 Tax=Sphingomonas quercus TaxID=2842451 RepID=A0ABS6BN72_9SPHN|nr:4-oxalocrotonate tautomerase family protein [Sphingomonas quercus]MBU3079302.1 4-oxalocrotonate tautomerase family protein [Sphingomonas quercus]